MPGLSGFGMSPADYNQAQIDSLNDMSSEDRAAAIFRQQYNRYQQVYQPVEDYIFQQLANWQPLTQEAQQASIFRAQQQYRNVQGQQDRQFRSLGIEPTAEQKESLTRQMDMQAAQAAINAANTTGRNMDSLKYGLVGGFGPYQVGR